MKNCTTPSHEIPDVGTACFQGPPRGGGCTRAPKKGALSCARRRGKSATSSKIKIAAENWQQRLT